MENTNTIRFADDRAEWFLSVNEKFSGPFQASEVYEKLQAGEVSWIDHGYREKEGQWVRISEHPTFKVLLPEAPKSKPVLAPPPPPKVEDETKWFLYQNETQSGPYPTREVKRLIQAGQLQKNAYVWNQKLTEWKLYSEMEELKIQKAPVPSVEQLLGKSPIDKNPAEIKSAEKKTADKRTAPRKPLVAQVYVANESKLITGICRDISVGGMQVLTDQVIWGPGTNIRLNVAPPQNTGLDPFVAEGVVIRILEDRRGFSFRFTQISNEAKKSIEGYIL